MPGKRRAESEERRAESGEQKETAHESHQSTRMGAGNDMVRDAAERDARQGERHALRSAGIRGNSALERSQPARLSRTTDGRGDGGSPRAWRRRPRRQPRNPSDRPDCTLLRNHRATGPAVPVCGGASPDRSYRTVGTAKRRSRVGEPTVSPAGSRGRAPIVSLSPLGERLPHWGTVRAGARRPCFAL
jgi:hypothetical protein